MSEIDGAVPKSPDIPRYLSHKEVQALEIAAIYPDAGMGATLSFKEEGFDPVHCAAEMFARYAPVPGDFYVVYKDGYASFSPRDAFLDGYIRIG